MSYENWVAGIARFGSIKQRPVITMQIQSPQKVARLICRVIDRVFKEMGRADELGSGVKNLFLFTKAYSGADPQLVEDDISRIITP